MIEFKNCVVVLIAVRGTARVDWLTQCLLSVITQELPESWFMEVMIGIDGAGDVWQWIGEHETFNVGISQERVGPHVMRNSLIAALDWGDAYAVFDADDVMLPGYLKSLIEYRDRFGGIVGADRRSINGEGRLLDGGMQYSFLSGVCMYGPEELAVLGGYRDWASGADRDFVMRARAAGIRVTRKPVALYHRRLWDGSVSAVAAASGERERLRAASLAHIQRGEIRVAPRVVQLQWRPERPGDPDVAPDKWLRLVL